MEEMKNEELRMKNGGWGNVGEIKNEELRMKNGGWGNVVSG